MALIVIDLIETYWDVKTILIAGCPTNPRFNRNILGCKVGLQKLRTGSNRI